MANHLSIKLIKGSKKFIFSISKFINNWKNLKLEPIDSSLKGKCIAYCPELPFGTLSFCYINIETMNTISSDMEINDFFTFSRIC